MFSKSIEIGNIRIKVFLNFLKSYKKKNKSKRRRELIQDIKHLSNCKNFKEKII